SRACVTRVGGGGVRCGREQYLQALASLSELTRAQAERVAGLLAKQGEVEASQGGRGAEGVGGGRAKQGEVQSTQVGRVAEDVVRRPQKNREILTRLVQREVKRQLGVLGMATRDEGARLQQRGGALEQEVDRASQATASPRASRSSTTRTRTASAGSGTA